MIREPKVFLYDEPLSNLDARLRVAMRVEIRKLHQRLGTTTLFVTHDQIEAMTLADRIVVMNKGVVEQVGTPGEVYNRPATTYVAGFIGTPGLNLHFRHRRFRRRRGRGRRRPATRPMTGSAGPSVGDGPVTVGFRAEAVRIGGARDVLKGEFDFAEEMGAARLLHGTFGGETVVANVGDDVRRAAGDALHISVDPADIQFFDSESGRRLPYERVAVETARTGLAESEHG